MLDLETFDYRSQEKVSFESLGAIRNEEDPKKRLKALIGFDDPAGRFAWQVLSRTLVYSARRLGEIADDIVNVDRAMRWGFNWDLGPFEAWDAIGVPESRRAHEERGHPGARVGHGHARLRPHELLRRSAGHAALLRPASSAPAPIPSDPRRSTSRRSRPPARWSKRTSARRSSTSETACWASSSTPR